MNAVLPVKDEQRGLISALVTEKLGEQLDGQTAAADGKPLTPYEAQHQTRGEELLAFVQHYLIASDADADHLSRWIDDEIVNAEKAIDLFFAPMAKATDAAHKAVTQMRARCKQVYAEPHRIGDDMLLAWAEKREQERQRALDEAAAAQQQLDEDIALDLALEAEEDGNPEQAERILNGDVPLVGPVITPPAAAAPVRIAGRAVKPVLVPKIDNIGAFIRAAGTRPDMLALISNDLKIIERLEASLKDVAKRLGDSLNMPGVKLVQETQIRRLPGRRS